MTPHWSFRWLSDNGIRDENDLARALGRSDVLNEMTLYAETIGEAVLQAVPSYSTVAGSGLDLSVESLFNCGSDICRRHQIDNLFRRVWHYFDAIVVDDSLGHFLREHRESETDDTLLRYARSFLYGLLYVRQIGGEDLIRFSEKSYDCDNWSAVASQIDLERLNDEREQFVRDVLREGEFSANRDPGGDLRVFISHPSNPLPLLSIIPSEEVQGCDETTLASKACHEVFDTLARYLVRDVVEARRINSPLTVGLPFHGRFLDAASVQHAPDAAILELPLPFIDGIPITALIELRMQENDSFIRFRTALKAAFAEYAATDRRRNGAHRAEITNDLILPELHKINQKFESAKKALAKKSAVGIAMGLATATCGVLSGYAALIPAGIVTAVGSAVTAEARFVDDLRELSLENMYFLWKGSRLH